MVMPHGDLPPSDKAKFEPRLPPPADSEAQGLGDLIKRVTSAVGFHPCGGCERRAEMLNRAVPFKTRPAQGVKR
jgi:hypothetical protein